MDSKQTLRIHIKLGEFEILAEGDPGEVKLFVEQHWPPEGSIRSAVGQKKSAAPKKGHGSRPKRKPVARSGDTSSGAESEQFDFLALANGLRGRPEFQTIQAQILDPSDRWEKCRLVLWAASAHVNSGDIHRALTELGVKISLLAISGTLKANRNHMLVDTSGRYDRFKLTDLARRDFEGQYGLL